MMKGLFEGAYLDSFIEVPFQYRHSCWFCGEPAGKLFTFPHQRYVVIDCSHPTLTLPTCNECTSLANQVEEDSIWLVKYTVKQQLIKTYQKHLAIGLNWTEQELAQSQFEGGNFESFQRSAWFMYEIAKARVNFQAWPLVLNGVAIKEVNIKASFSFDGVTYPTVDDAIDYFEQHFSLVKGYLKQVVASLGNEQFAKAVSFCRIMVGSTPAERKQALKQLILDQF